MERRQRLSILAIGLVGLGPLLLASASRADEVPFGPRNPIATLPGLTVVGVEVADVDGDADLDAIAASPITPSFEPGLLAWYPNTDGRGSFGSAQTIAPGRALDLLVADLDGDGDPDVVEGSVFNSVLWNENSAGDGTAWTQRTVASFGALPGMAVDVDGDGDTDLISTSNGVHWHESDGATPPAFVSHPFVAPPEGYGHAVAGFLDGDTALDLLAVEHGIEGLPQDPPPILAWLQSDGQQPPAFATHPIDVTGACPLMEPDPNGLLRCTWVRAADVDGDGDLDVLIAAGSEIAWFENQRPPRSTIPALPAFPRALLVAALLWVSLRAIRRLRSG